MNKIVEWTKLAILGLIFIVIIIGISVIEAGFNRTQKEIDDIKNDSHLTQLYNGSDRWYNVFNIISANTDAEKEDSIDGDITYNNGKTAHVKISKDVEGGFEYNEPKDEFTYKWVPGSSSDYDNTHSEREQVFKYQYVKNDGIAKVEKTLTDIS